MKSVQESSIYFSTLVFDGEDVTDDLGERVAAARQGRRWSQARLAERAGLSRASIYRIEQDGRSARPDTILRIAWALGRGVEDLVPGWHTKPERPDEHMGLAMRARRRALGLTLKELALRVGVSEATLSRHERGVLVSKLLRWSGDRYVVASPELAAALDWPIG